MTNKTENDTAFILTVEGRCYPVDIHYSIDPLPNYVNSATETVLNIHKSTNKDGDILVFMPGVEEIEAAVKLLREEAKKYQDKKMSLKILPMYSNLPAHEQMRVFSKLPDNTRKVVIATNIAETSITINGIVYVIDSGFIKMKAYNPSCGIETLVIAPVSQAAAIQRAGRAARVRAGKVYRMYTEDQYKKLSPVTIPEIQRTDLSKVILQLKALGISNVWKFPLLSKPSAQNFIRGLELLYALGAINDVCNLTIPLGVNMAEFPLSPMYTKMLLSSPDFGCVEEALIIVSMMQIQNIFLFSFNKKISSIKSKRKFACIEGDHLTYLNVYKAFDKNRSRRWCNDNHLNYKGLQRADEIIKQLSRILQSLGIKVTSCEGDTESVRKCLTTGFFSNAAKLHYSGDYRTIRDEHSLKIQPNSVLYHLDPLPPWVIFDEIVQTKQEYMCNISVIESDWLYELAPHFYQLNSL